MQIDYDRSIIDIIAGHGQTHPDRPALIFDQGEGAVDQLSYSELVTEIRELAGAFVANGLAGKRVGLLFAPGLDFVRALLACFAVGSVAVPIAPIGRRRARLQNLLGMIAEFDPEALILDASMANTFGLELADALTATESRYLEFQSLKDSRSLIDPLPILPDDLAVLQFTSGTTRNPKGVMITHGNILADETIIRHAFAHDGDSHFVGWVPHYHDQGLFGNILQPLFLGSTCVLTSPATFIKTPLAWLDLISRYRAHTSGGPNFGFDLCIRQAVRKGLPDIDLSCWHVAFNGAEQVRPKTLERFAGCFAPVGFDKRAFLPCYGLAECTLVTVASPPMSEPVCAKYDSTALSEGRAEAALQDKGSVDLTCCGPAMAGSTAIIVEPDTGRSLSNGEVGEIWLGGPHIAQGYWNHPEKTQEVFGARLSNGEGPYARTGDLGFSTPDGIYVVGRISDLIIINGRNFPPSDLELIWSEMLDHGGLGRSAAVQIEVGDSRHVALIAEFKRSDLRELTDADFQQMAVDLRSSAMEQLDLGVTDLVLVSDGAIPRTTSGKVQRRMAAKLLMDGNLPVVSVAGPLEPKLPEPQNRVASVRP